MQLCHFIRTVTIGVAEVTATIGQIQEKRAFQKAA
jgi:hypothetical protein